MKTWHNLKLVALVSLSALTASAPLSAQVGTSTQYWDSNGTSAGLGGSGLWSLNNWATSNSGTGTTSAWAGSNSIAAFDGVAGTVDADVATNAAGLNFLGDGFKLRGGPLVFGLPGAVIQCSSGVNATIALPISGTVGLNKTGAGSLILSGSNRYTGSTVVSAGLLQIGSYADWPPPLKLVRKE